MNTTWPSPGLRGGAAPKGAPGTHSACSRSQAWHSTHGSEGHCLSVRFIVSPKPQGGPPAPILAPCSFLRKRKEKEAHLSAHSYPPTPNSQPWSPLWEADLQLTVGRPQGLIPLSSWAGEDSWQTPGLWGQLSPARKKPGSSSSVPGQLPTSSQGSLGSWHLFAPSTQRQTSFFRATPAAYGGPRLGVELKLQLPAHATATATRDPSRICHLHHSS